jgi:YVTN family beta-propeller protein
MGKTCILLILAACGSFAQTTGATFGEIVKLGGTPSDVVLDESRGRLYLVNQSAGRVDIYDYLGKRIAGTFPTGAGPVAAAISMDGNYLYVTNNTASSLTVIDLALGSVADTVSLSVKPSGVEVGADGRVLMSTEGTSTTDTVESLLLYDRAAGQQVTPVSFAPPPATPSPLPATTIGRPVTTFRGKLIRTPDGNYIIGMSTVNNNAQTVLFVYEVSSASILRSRTVTGQSTVLSISPDGARVMAGYSLYNTANLNVIAQQSAANVPFPLSSTGTATFSTLQNVGGSAFSPDGATIYSAFNVAPYSTPAPRPQASTLLISSSRHLGVRLGIKVPESIVARIAITSDGANAWGLSESGLIYLPLSTLYDHPILQPESTVVFLRSDDCNRGLAKGTLQISNAGKGKLTFSVPDTTAALTAQATSGLAPSIVEFTMDPGRTTVTRQYGTNLYSGGATNSGTALSVNLSSADAINIPPTIKVYMNLRQPDQRGVVYPVQTVPTAAEGLQDILVDEPRDRV